MTRILTGIGVKRIPRHHGSPLRRLSALSLAMLTAVSSLASVPAATPSSVPDDSLKPVRTEPVPALQTVSTVFDNFNRTVSNQLQTWGTASSGAVWAAFGCESGYTARVDGSSGVMTGSAGAVCTLVSGANQVASPPNSAIRFWDGPSWAFSAKLKVSALDGSQLTLRISEPNAANTAAGMYLTFGGPDSGVWGPTGVVPYAWQANVWYSIKWAVIWGDQQRLKVWPSSDPEPSTWLVAATAGPYQAADGHAFITEWHSTVGATSVYQDDYAYGPAPILPKLPPPPGTDRNGQDTNSATGGDPVSTLTGSFGYHHTDLAIPGRGPAISFTRSYNSNDTRPSTLGPGWTHSYNVRLNDPDDGSGDVVLVGPDGRSDRYTKSGSVFVPPPTVFRTLVQNADGSYTATAKDLTVWQFDASGLLTQIADRYGNVSTLRYDVNNRLSSVSDPAGRGSLTFAYANGLLSSVTDWATPARTVGYQYDASNRLWKVTDREGKVTTFAYDGASSRLASITDARSHVAMTLTYDANGRVATQKDARGIVTGDVTTFGYVVNGDGTRVTTVTHPVTSFEPSFHPTTVDTYDAHGWLTSRIAHPSATETLTEAFGYDTAGNRTSHTDARGGTTDFCYDVSYTGSLISGSTGNLTRQIEPAPISGANRPVTLTAFDAKNNVVQRVSPKGVPSGTTVTCSTDLSAINPAYATDLSFDASGVRLVSTTTRFTDPDLGLMTATTKYEYGDAANPGRVTRVIPPRGNTTASPDYTYATVFTYYTSGSSAGMLSTAANALGDTTSYSYDALGRLTQRVDPLGNPAIGGYGPYHTTSFSYDKEDRLRFTTLPGPLNGGAGLVTETRYDEVGNPIVRIDPTGQVTTYAYDDRDGLLQVKESPSAWTDPATPPGDVITTEYGYDAAGNLARMTRAKGDASNERVTDYAYDGRGRERSETQYPSWPATSPTLVTSMAYDAGGNLVTMIEPLGQMTTNGYDALNRLSSISYSDGTTPNVTYGYDANGNRASMGDGTGSTSYVYDEANRMTSTTSPGPKTVAYRYDLDGNRTKVIYPDSTAVTYTFNKASQLSSLQDWGSRTVAYAYWPDGLLKAASNPDGTSASYAYDNARRLVDIAHTGPTGAYLDRSFYTLSSAGNVTAVNHGLLPAQVARPDGLVGSNGTWTGTYASINEATPNDSTLLASPAGPTSSNYYEVSLSDVLPPMDLTSLNLRYRVSKSGNDGGQTTSLTIELRQGSTVINGASYQSLPGSSGSGWIDGTLTISQQAAPTITNYNDLRIRFVPGSTGGGQARKAQISWLEFDVPSPADPTAQTTYGYDRLNRLTSSSGPDGARSYGYDPVGNRTSKVLSGTTTYTYDRADRMTAAGAAAVTVNANGNMTSRGADSFTYDQANRLKTATVTGSTETYAYDGDGVRFSRQIGSGTPIRYVSDRNRGLPVTLDDGTRKFVYGPGLAYAVSGSTVEVYHGDRLATIRALTTTGSVVATYRSDDWGNLLSQTGSSSQPFAFTGEARDATGLTYMRARYYDPTLGRMTTRDPVRGLLLRPTSLDGYAYALDAPTVFADHTGLWTAGICSELGLTVFGATFGGSLCIVVSSSFQFGVTVTGGGGGAPVSAPRISGSAGVALQFSNADQIEDLGGPFYQVGASAGSGVGAEASAFGGLGSCQQPVAGFNIGLQITTPSATVYGMGTGTDARTLLGSSRACEVLKSQVLQ